jgi:CRP/FNR family transcriptional regulator
MSGSRNMMQNSCTIGTGQLDCISVLSEKELELFESKMITVTYKRNEVLCKQGTLSTHIMLIREGLVKLYLEGSSDNLILQIMPPSNIIGLSNCFDNNHLFYYSAKAYVDTLVSLIDMETFKQIMKTNAEFATKMVGYLAEHSIITYGRFYCFTQKQTYGRFADIILCLANRIYKMDKFPMQLNRRELAELAGMSIESVARIMTRFKEENIVAELNGYLEITDKEKLLDISLKG